MVQFGTDGIRGKFNDVITPQLALDLGLASGEVFQRHGIKSVCIGEDTRNSSPLIANLLTTGLNAFGIEVYDMGVVPTASVSYTIVNHDNIDVGIMVSASHNPYYDNGIKFFGANGKKIDEELEKELENALNKEEKYDVDINNIKSIDHSDEAQQLVNDYKEFIISLGESLKGKKIALDCANGAGFEVAQEIFKELGADIIEIGVTPNGVNINDGIGSTHPEKLMELVKSEKADFGFAYDGDADRVQLVDNTGELLDGDYMLYMLAKDFKAKNKLVKNQLVSTVMANLGFKKALNELAVDFLETPVGDKYVMREMDKTKANVGGEQSGHVILSDYITTGDGILTSIILSNIIVGNDFSFEELKKELIKFPQVLHNYKCEDKNKILNDKEFNDYVEEENIKLQPNGRILVRPSGTEELIRIMVESETLENCNEIIDKVLQRI